MSKSISLADLSKRNKKDPKDIGPVISRVSYVQKAVNTPSNLCLICFYKLNNKGKNNASILFRSLSPIYFPKNFNPPKEKVGDSYLFCLSQSEALQVDAFKQFGYKKNNIQDLINKISNRIFVVFSYAKDGYRHPGDYFDSFVRDDDRKSLINENPESLPFSLIPELEPKELSRLEKSSSFNLLNYPLDFFPMPEWVYGEDKFYKISSFLKSSENENTTHFAIEKARVYEAGNTKYILPSNGFVFACLNRIITKDTKCLYSLPRTKEEKKKSPAVKITPSVARIDESIIRKTYDKYPNDKMPTDSHIRNIISGINRVIKAFHKKNYNQRQVNISHIRDELRSVFYVVVKYTAPNNRKKSRRKNASSLRKYVSGRQDFWEVYRKGRNRNKSRPGGTFYLAETIFLFDAFSHLFNDEYNEHNLGKIEQFRKRSSSDQDALLYSFIYFFYNLNLTIEEKTALDNAFSIQERLKQIKEKAGK